MSERVLYVILTSQSRSPINHFEQITKIIADSKSGHSTETNLEIEIFHWRGPSCILQILIPTWLCCFLDYRQSASESISFVHVAT